MQANVNAGVLVRALVVAAHPVVDLHAAILVDDGRSTLTQPSRGPPVA